MNLPSLYHSSNLGAKVILTFSNYDYNSVMPQSQKVALYCQAAHFTTALAAAKPGISMSFFCLYPWRSMCSMALKSFLGTARDFVLNSDFTIINIVIRFSRMFVK